MLWPRWHLRQHPNIAGAGAHYEVGQHPSIASAALVKLGSKHDRLVSQSVSVPKDGEGGPQTVPCGDRPG